MVSVAQIGRKMTYRRRTRWFLQRAVQQAVQPQAAQLPMSETPAEVLAQWNAEGMGDSWASRADIEDSASYARTLREKAQRREINR